MARAIKPQNHVSIPATNFHTFPDTGTLNLAGLGGGTAVASSDFTRGSNQTLKVTTAAGVNAEVRKTAAYDIRNRKMGIWVYVPDYTQWSNFLLYVGSSGFAAFSNWTYSFAAADKQYNGWHFIDTQPDNWTGGTPTDFTIAQQDFKIRCTPQASTVAVCYLDSIEVGQWNRPKLLLTYDDGYSASWTDAFGIQYANGLGLKANLAITAAQIDANATWLSSAQLAAAYAAGNDLVTHGEHGASGVATNGANAVLDGILFNRNFLETRGYTRGSRFYVYPNGFYQLSAGDQWILNQLKIAGMLAARGTVTPVTMQPKVGSQNLYQLPIIGMQAADAPATVIASIDLLIRRGQTSFLMFHEIVAAGAATTQVNSADHKTVMDAIALRVRQGLLDVPTCSAWWTSLNYGSALAA